MTTFQKLKMTTALVAVATLALSHQATADCVPANPVAGDTVTCTGIVLERTDIPVDDVTLIIVPGAVMTDPDSSIAISGSGDGITVRNGGTIRQTDVPTDQRITGIQLQQDGTILNEAGALVDIAGRLDLTGLRVGDGGLIRNAGVVQILVADSGENFGSGDVEAVRGSNDAQLINERTGIIRVTGIRASSIYGMTTSFGTEAGEITNEGLIDLQFTNPDGGGGNTAGIRSQFTNGGLRITNTATGTIRVTGIRADGILADTSDIIVNEGQIVVTQPAAEAPFVRLSVNGMSFFKRGRSDVPGEARNIGTITVNGPGGIGVYAGTDQPFINEGTIETTGTGGLNFISVRGGRGPSLMGPVALYFVENDTTVVNEATGVLRVTGVNSSAVKSGDYSWGLTGPITPAGLPGSRFTNRGLVEGQRAGVEATGGPASDEFFLTNDGRIVALGATGDGVLIEGTKLALVNTGTIEGVRTGLLVRLHTIPEGFDFSDYVSGTFQDLVDAQNSGTIRGGTGVSVTGEIIGFVNTGRVEGTGDGPTSGAMLAMGRILGLENSGVLLASGEGAIALGSKSATEPGRATPDLSVFNTGRIEAPLGTAIHGSGTGLVDNAGVIAGRDGAIHLLGIGTGDTEGTEIINRAGGAITSTAGPAILVEGQKAVIRNDGHIDGGASGVAIRLDGAFDNELFVGTGGTMTGIVDAGGTGKLTFGLVGDDSFDLSGLGPTGQYLGFSTIEKTGLGILSLTGTADASGVGLFDVLGGGVTLDGAQFDGSMRLGSGTVLAGTGRLGAIVQTAGATLSPGTAGAPIGTISATGDVRLSGDYLVDIDASGGSDLVTSDTSITLSGASLTVNGIGYPTGYPDSQSYTILQAPTITGSFATVQDNLPDVDVTLSYGASSTELSYVRTTTPGPGGPQPVLSDDGILADGLQGLVHDARLVNGALLRSARADAAPTVGFGPAISSKGAADLPVSFGLGSLRARGDRGYDSDTRALMFTAETRIPASGGETVLGLSLGLMESEHSRAGSSVTSESTLAGLYAGHSFGPFEVRGALSFGRSDLSLSRFIAGPNVTARGDTESRSRSLSLEASYDIGPQLGAAAGTRIAPLVRFDHVHAEFDGYTETGAGVLNRTVSASDWSRSWLGLGVRVETGLDAGSKLRTSAEIRVDKAFGDEMAAVSSGLLIGGAGFTARGIADADTSFAVGFGLEADLDNGATFETRLDGTFADGRSSGALSMSLRIAF